MELPAGFNGRGINADEFSVGAESWMGVDTPLSGVGRREMELSEVNSFLHLHVKQMRRLEAFLPFGIGVVQNPFISRQVREVTGRIENSMTDLFDRPVLFVFKQKVDPVGVAERFF